jgi:hypothetical protein
VNLKYTIYLSIYRYYSTTLLRYYATTLLYYATTLLRYYSTTLLRYYVTTLLRYYATTLLRYYATTLLLYYFTTLLRYYATTLLRYYAEVSTWKYVDDTTVSEVVKKGDTSKSQDAVTTVENWSKSDYFLMQTNVKNSKSTLNPRNRTSTLLQSTGRTCRLSKTLKF